MAYDIYEFDRELNRIRLLSEMLLEEEYPFSKPSIIFVNINGCVNGYDASVQDGVLSVPPPSCTHSTELKRF